MEEGDLAMVDLYLGAKVDVNCRGDEAYGGERSPLSVAVEFRRREVIAKLEAAGAREW